MATRKPRKLKKSYMNALVRDVTNQLLRQGILLQMPETEPWCGIKLRVIAGNTAAVDSARRRLEMEARAKFGIPSALIVKSCRFNSQAQALEGGPETFSRVSPGLDATVLGAGGRRGQPQRAQVTLSASTNRVDVSQVAGISADGSVLYLAEPIDWPDTEEVTAKFARQPLSDEANIWLEFEVARHIVTGIVGTAQFPGMEEPRDFDGSESPDAVREMMSWIHGDLAAFMGIVTASTAIQTIDREEIYRLGEGSALVLDQLAA